MSHKGLSRWLGLMMVLTTVVGCVNVVQSLPTAGPTQAPVATRGPAISPGPISPTVPPISTLPPTATLAPGVTPAPGATPGPVTPPTPGPVGPVDNARLVAATVMIATYEDRNGQLQLKGFGSGTIITPDGVIVTNAHVAAPDASGLAVQYRRIGGFPPVAQLEIRLTENEDQPPVARYHAEVLAVDGYLDIAVIKIATTIDGQPATNLNLPWLGVGDSDALRIGDPLTVVGFPGIGGETVSADRGDVSGFVDDPKIGTRGWVKTSAIVHQGNSGGLGANAQGELVAVPTRAPEFAAKGDVGGFQLLRPINLAQPVIDAALQGTQYGPSPYVMAGTGLEQVVPVGWLAPEAKGCSSSEMVSSYPTGTTALNFGFSYSGLTPGLDIVSGWRYMDPGTGRPVDLLMTKDVWEGAASGECRIIGVNSRSPLADGAYQFGLGIGPWLRIVVDQEVTVGGAPGPGPDDPAEGVLLSGRVLDATTGRGIAGANVYVLAPGEDVQAFLDGEPALTAATATTDAEGRYELNKRIAESTTFPMVIGARRYRPWAGTLTTGTEDDFLEDLLLSPVRQ